MLELLKTVLEDRIDRDARLVSMLPCLPFCKTTGS